MARCLSPSCQFLKMEMTNCNKNSAQRNVATYRQVLETDTAHCELIKCFFSFGEGAQNGMPRPSIFQFFPR